MKKFAFGFAAALALGLASFAVPASAAPSQPAGMSSDVTDVSAQRVVRRTVIRRSGPFCSTRVVKTRRANGSVVVRRTRVCR